MIPDEEAFPQKKSVILQRISQKYQKLLDDVTPYTLGRWIAAVVLILAFLSRVFLLQGWYIVTYGLGIYHLNLLIGFLSPKIDPAFSDDYEDDHLPGLPTRDNEEFKPFIRRLPEFKCWNSVIKSTLFAFITTFFEFFNIPVFWPILLLYFIVLFGLTMKKQIKFLYTRILFTANFPIFTALLSICLCYSAYSIHMIKYRYIPFSFGKPKYQSANNSADSAGIKR